MEVTLPKYGVTMQEAELVDWLEQEGARVEEGQVIAQVATDKVEVEVEAPAAGILVRHCVAEGDVVLVGAVIAVIEEANSAGQ